MAVISAQVIQRPRRARCCDSLLHEGSNAPSRDPIMRLYGNADDPDPKWSLFICVPCGYKSFDPVVLSALRMSDNPIPPVKPSDR